MVLSLNSGYCEMAKSSENFLRLQQGSSIYHSSKLENIQDSMPLQLMIFSVFHSAPAQLRRRVLEASTVDPSELFAACL